MFMLLRCQSNSTFKRVLLSERASAHTLIELEAVG